ncbi:MAG: hypothetical protein CML55_04430 [Rhodobacteraceae bacterium]|nr:hypothetical protein [Paracoccaceae bacterium]
MGDMQDDPQYLQYRFLIRNRVGKRGASILSLTESCFRTQIREEEETALSNEAVSHRSDKRPFH